MYSKCWKGGICNLGYSTQGRLLLTFRIKGEINNFSDKQKLKDQTYPKRNVKGSSVSGKEKVTIRSENL